MGSSRIVLDGLSSISRTARGQKVVALALASRNLSILLGIVFTVAASNGNGKIELDPIWTDERKRQTYGNGERYFYVSYGIPTDERNSYALLQRSTEIRLRMNGNVTLETRRKPRARIFQVDAEEFDSATVFFSDIADFHDIISVNSFPIDIIAASTLKTESGPGGGHS